MSKKKESRKAKSADRTEQFIEHVRQYSDFKGFDFNNFPQNLPSRFQLKLGTAVVGNAVVNWRDVIAKLFNAAAAMSKPDELSDDEYTEQFQISLESSTPEQLNEAMLPFFGIIIHMMEYLPQKLNDAVLDLSLEGRHHIVIRREKQRGSQNIPSVAKFAAYIGGREEEAIKNRLPEIRGGSSPEIDVSDGQCVMLSDAYPVLHQHWCNVKGWHKKKENWRDHAKVDQSDTPDDLLDKLCGLDIYERQPSTLAHEHAARRCGIPANKYSLSTLSRLRRKGDKIRSQSKPTK